MACPRSWLGPGNSDGSVPVFTASMGFKFAVGEARCEECNSGSGMCDLGFKGIASLITDCSTLSIHRARAAFEFLIS